MPRLDIYNDYHHFNFTHYCNVQVHMLEVNSKGGGGGLLNDWSSNHNKLRLNY